MASCFSSTSSYDALTSPHLDIATSRCYDAVMRTTLQIDDDVLAAARGLARAQSRSVGEVISELARKALTTPLATRKRNGVPVVVVPAGAQPITPEDVRVADEEE